MTAKRLVSRISAYTFLAFYAVVIFMPIYIMLMTSFKDNRGALGAPLMPGNFGYVDNYLTMITRSNYGVYFVNSLIIVAITLGIVILVSSIAAFVLAKYHFPGNRLIYTVFIAGLFIPIKLGTVSMLKTMVGLGINDNLLSVIIIFAAMGIPFGVFILTDFIKMIPEELSNAARIDGCSDVGIFSRIIVPLLMPAIAAVSIVNFIPVWNDFWFPLVMLKSDAVKTVPLATALLFGQYQTKFGYVFAVLCLASLPVIIFYLAASKWFVKGITAGALKG